MDATLIVPRAAGIVPARRTKQGWRLLVLRGRRNWEFPSAGVLPQGDPLATAKRRTRDETGITDLRFPFGAVYRDPAPNAHGRLPRHYLAVTEQEQVTLEKAGDDIPPEHDEARWVSLDDAWNLLPQLYGPVLSWTRNVLAGK